MSRHSEVVLLTDTIENMTFPAIVVRKGKIHMILTEINNFRAWSQHKDQDCLQEMKY